MPTSPPRPVPLASRGVAGAVVVALLTLLATGLPAAASGDAAARFVQRIGQERATAGLPGLRTAGDLAEVATRHAHRMAAEGRVYHNPSMTSEVSGWQRLTENVGTGPEVAPVHDAFMASAGHRANILDGKVTEVGVGVVWADGRLWVSQVFRLPDGSAAAAAPAPAPDPEPAPAPAAPGSAPEPPPPPLSSGDAPATPGPGAPTLASSIRWELPEVSPAPAPAVAVGPASAGAVTPAAVPPSVHARTVARWLVVVGAILDG